ncbi:MAG: hypothetical protein Q9167_001154 [Letrouitia subvulpina]
MSFSGFGGGFTSNNNTGSGFGQSSNAGFGTSSSAPSGGLFGTSNSGFGSGGFGATGSTSTPFGSSNTGFGSTNNTSGGIFGGNQATSGSSGGFGGGFSSGNANTNSGGLFGAANKTPFGGSQPSSSGTLFGSGSNTFGSNNTQPQSAFGAPISSALSANNADCQGTGSTPFQAYTEKEGTVGNQTNHFQSLTFNQPYKNFSFEELRQADYNQGRRYGNGSGQAGAFGTSTGFGGFGGQSTGGAFGSNNQSSGIFGSQSTPSFGGGQTANSGFGSNNNTGSVFSSSGAKPGGIFGSTSQSTGGLFGSGQSGGFGAQNNPGSSANTGFGSGSGGGLFGQNNQQQQQPKTSFSFTPNNNNTSGFGASGASGFGAGNTNTSSGGGIFGTTQTSSPFGGGQQQANSNPFGGFGTNQQNQTQNNPAPTFGGFGTNNQQQQKPGAFFGNTNNANNNPGGLFGTTNTNNNQQQQTGGGLFGPTNNNNNQTGGSSLFGPKPASTGGGLFGNNNANNSNSTSSLFGPNNTNQNQQNQAGGLFANSSNQQQQKAGSLFPSSTTGGLFSNNSTSNQPQNNSSSLFSGLGSNNQQQQTGGPFGNNANNYSTGLFNNSQQQQQTPNNALQPPQAYTASITDPYPYGNASIFDGLPPPPQDNPGPIATPISARQKTKKPAVLPHYQINPLVASTRYTTPQKRGYGFSYSTYGTPASVSSNVSTPGGFSSSLLHGSISRGLGKSFSTSNLRRAFESDQESLLSPGAFSTGSARFSSPGSLKKLTIDRSLRTDLFSSPANSSFPSPERNDRDAQPRMRKKVSFDASTIGGTGGQPNGGSSTGANGLIENATNHSSPETTPDQSSKHGVSHLNGSINELKSNGAPSQSEMEQVRGNELAVIAEDGNHEPSNPTVNNQAPQVSQLDPEPGDYYIRPSRADLDRMSKEQKAHMTNFCIGREGCGYVVFDQPVDLNTVNLDDIEGKIALINVRSLTIYPPGYRKPAQGQGLNVPATIYLANSWPRTRDRKMPSYEKSGVRFNKHVDRLRKVQDTQFVRYEKDTGTWVFKVPHFTTYGFDYEDDESEINGLLTSSSSAPPDTPTPKFRRVSAGATPGPTGFVQESSTLTSDISLASSGPDDTFEFRRKKMLPGAFDGIAAFEEDADMDHEIQETDHADSFLGERLTISHLRNGSEVSSFLHGNQASPHDGDIDMAGSFPEADQSSDRDEQDISSKRNVKPSYFGSRSATPRSLRFNETSDWADKLQRTVSPKKQDRQALREEQKHVMQDRDAEHDGTPSATKRNAANGPKLATSIDLMNSIFGQDKSNPGGFLTAKSGQVNASKIPNAKKSKPLNADNDLIDKGDREWHNSYKPSWGPAATLFYATPSNVNTSSSVVSNVESTHVSKGRGLRLAKLSNIPFLVTENLTKQKDCTKILVDRGVPYAAPQSIPMKDVSLAVSPNASAEKLIWELASILFDDLNSDAYGTIPQGERASYEFRIRKDNLSTFWASLCTNASEEAVKSAPSAEERAIGFLSANQMTMACQALIEGRDFRLATLIAQLPADEVMCDIMTQQIGAWRELKVLSEITDPIRTLYSFCAGNVSICEGYKAEKVELEDKAKTFAISSRFDLDWRRAFGLRLWYGTRAEEPVESAVQKFYNDIQNDEPKKPVPLFTISKSAIPWQNDDPSKHQDILWGLLKLYAASKGVLGLGSIAAMVMPNNMGANSMDFRLSFQLYQALCLRFPQAHDVLKADQLTWDFATQLESAGEWLWASFALLHLSDRDKRQKALYELLARHAAKIWPDDETVAPFKTLREEFKIPSSWIWQAKALHARSVLQDHSREVLCLIQATDWEEAHNVLCGIVGPKAVIEQNWETLRELLKGFRAGKENIEQWQTGGGVYEDYMALVNGVEGAEKTQVVRRLLDALPAVVYERDGKLGFEEGVAIKDMAGEVAKLVLKGQVKGIDASRVLQLPLTNDAYLRHSIELSLQYYKAVMAGKGTEKQQAKGGPEKGTFMSGMRPMAKPRKPVY